MKYIYDSESDQTIVELDGEKYGTIDGKVTNWRNGIPHPDTDQFNQFEKILLEMNTPDERDLLLHLIAGEISRDGFGNDQS